MSLSRCGETGRHARFRILFSQGSGGSSPLSGTMPYEETWIKTHCNKCKKANWICEGNMQDLTVPDTEAIECWNCGHKWWRDPDNVEDMHDDPDQELDDYAEKGYRSPH